MTKEKISSLTKYADGLRNNLSAPTPSKHKNHPATYTQFLERELKAVTTQLDNAKLEALSVSAKK